MGRGVAAGRTPHRSATTTPSCWLTGLRRGCWRPRGDCGLHTGSRVRNPVLRPASQRCPLLPALGGGGKEDGGREGPIQVQTSQGAGPSREMGNELTGELILPLHLIKSSCAPARFLLWEAFLDSLPVRFPPVCKQVPLHHIHHSCKLTFISVTILSVFFLYKARSVLFTIIFSAPT